jgi:hypothetical protein
MDAKKTLMNSMTSCEKEDMVGENEWLGELNPGRNGLGENGK